MTPAQIAAPMQQAVKVLARALGAKRSDDLDELEAHCAECRERAASYRTEARALLAEIAPMIAQAAKAQPKTCPHWMMDAGVRGRCIQEQARERGKA